MPFDFDAIKDLIVCPASKSALVMQEQALICVDPECRLRFEVRDDIPNLLVEKATQVSEEEWRAVMTSHGRDSVTGKRRDESV